MDIPANVGVSENTIGRVATALSLGIDPQDIQERLIKDGISDRDIYVALIAGDVHNRMTEKEYPLDPSDK